MTLSPARGVRALLAPILAPILALAGLALLAACGSGGGGHPYGIPPQFGDTKPHAWSGKVPAHYSVHGVDVSRYQGNIDWPRASGSGVAFAFIKATEGVEIADPMFGTNWQQTASIGLPRGAYHFYYFCRTGADQARWFIQNVPQDASALPPVLDIEWTHSRSCPRRPDPATVRAEALDFLNIVDAYYGKKPIIYTTVDFFEQNQMWMLDDYPFWLRSVAGHPKDVYGSHHWTFWQYTGTGLAPGFRGNVDLNAFYGAPAELQAWVASR